tara:strand:- start:814 stop:1080 length:267 start_codon:yes stop_codon:yes gene_type:complete
MQTAFSNETTSNNRSLFSVPIQKELAISAPIKIPHNKSNPDLSLDNLFKEYQLNLNSFNPSKMSPPDPWKERLEQRIRSLDYDNSCKE